MWNIVLDILCAWNVIFALALLIISGLTYLRARKIKFLLVNAVFLLFFVKGVLASIGLFYPEKTLSANSAVVLDCVILAVLFFAIMRR